jgi:hypothetical protein
MADMRRIALVAIVLLLLGAGGASAYALRMVFIKPGHCTKVHGTRVCARRAAPHTVTTTVTVTVGPSPIGETFSGNGDKTLQPLTLSHGVTATWTSKPDSDGFNQFQVSSSPDDASFVEFDNGDSSSSGSSSIPAGTYTFEINAGAAWTLSF